VSVVRVGRTLIRMGALSTKREVRHWRREFTRPWLEGPEGRPAEIGRWIGVGLAVSTLIIGIGAALRTERPWE
jgi:hypothetical protein